ncbi:MAG: hypothetical protein ACE5I1_29790, partial [bacterium]
TLAENETIDARLLDLNANGLRCSISPKTGRLPQLHRYLQRIVVRSRTLENPLVCSGIVRRVEKRHRARSLSVAIEFSAVLSGQYPEPDKPEIQNFKSQIPKSLLNEQGFESLTPNIASLKDKSSGMRKFSVHEFLMRLQDAKPFARCQNKVEKQRLRMQLHRSFSDIADCLPAEEKWWFFHVLDSLKNSGMPYQEDLLAEYLKLCKKSVEKDTSCEIIIDSLP